LNESAHQTEPPEEGSLNSKESKRSSGLRTGRESCEDEKVERQSCRALLKRRLGNGTHRIHVEELGERGVDEGVWLDLIALRVTVGGVDLQETVISQGVWLLSLRRRTHLAKIYAEALQQSTVCRTGELIRVVVDLYR
jgi:hypothetical protein